MPQSFIAIEYTGVASSLQHQTFFVVGKIKRDTKMYYMKNYVLKQESMKSFSNTQLESIWNASYHTMQITDRSFATMEKFIESNTRYFTNLDGPKATIYRVVVNGKRYKVAYDPTMRIFADLANYLKKNNCDSSVVKEMNWYVEYYKK